MFGITKNKRAPKTNNKSKEELKSYYDNYESHLMNQSVLYNLRNYFNWLGNEVVYSYRCGNKLHHTNSFNKYQREFVGTDWEHVKNFFTYDDIILKLKAECKKKGYQFILRRRGDSISICVSNNESLLALEINNMEGYY